MGVQLTQTDTAATCGAIAACGGNALATIPGARQATFNATAGTIPPIITVEGGFVGSVKRAAVMFQADASNFDLTGWNAGDWTIRLNVTTGNSNLDWKECYICRLDGSCGSLSTLGSKSGINITLTAGVKSTTITGVSGVGSPGASDSIYIVLVFQHPGGIASLPQSAAFTPDQLIDTPFTKTLVGNGTSSVSFSGAGNGSASSAGSGSSATSFGSVGAGAAMSAGSGASAVSFESVGGGTATSSGSGVSSFTVVGSGLGLGLSTGSGASTMTMVGSGVGAALSIGVGTSLIEFDSIGAGAAISTGLGLSEVAFVGSGVGISAAVGLGQSLVTFEGTGSPVRNPSRDYYVGVLADGEHDADVA